MMKKISLASLGGCLVAIAIPLLTGSLAAFLTQSEMAIYNEVVTPKLSPPSILFPIVWTILYFLMGFSSWMIWSKRRQAMRTVVKGLAIYALSLGLNFGWCLIFFNARQFLLAFIWLLVLWVSIVLTIVIYSRLSHKAAWLQLPYLIWVSFAGYLNLAIWWLNR